MVKKNNYLFQIGYLFYWLANVTFVGVIDAKELDFNVIRDLELFSSVNASHQGVVGFFDHTYTCAGKHMLPEFFKSLGTDINIIQRQQNGIRELLQNTDLYNQLSLDLKTIGQYEANLKWPSEYFGDTTMQSVIEKFYFSAESLEDFNTSPRMLNASYYGKMFGIASPLIEHLILHYAFKYFNGEHEHCEHGHRRHHHDHHHHHAHDDHACVAQFFPVEILPFIEALHLGMHLWSLTEMIQDFAAQKEVYSLLYKQMAYVSVCLKSLRSIYESVKNNQAIVALIGDESGLKLLFDLESDLDHREIMETLLGDYFDISFTPGLISPVGQTLSAYQQLQGILPRLSQAFIELAFIDAFVSIATHIKQAQLSGNNKFCFVDFIQSESPCIEFKNMWNISLGQDAKPVNFYCGNNYETSKIILTGPNKAGKTFFAKTAALNILLAQKFGIAAAESARMTLFSDLISYMIITDDSTADQSKFIAGLAQAEKCMNAHKNLEQGQFIFTILDDSLFEGTTAQKREQKSYNFVKELGKFPNSILLVATHLDALTNLEHDTEGIFKNYRMKTYIGNDGLTHSAFELEPGISPQSAVFDIIDEKTVKISADQG